LIVAENSFDYIIAGGGLAGLSLAFYLDESVLRDKKILIIDRDAKTRNDHTWCFWETGAGGAFEQIVFRRWTGVWFHGTRGFSKFLDLGEYAYKMIRAKDFYEFVFARIRQNPNFTFLQASIESVENARVTTDKGDFIAGEFVFDSFTRKSYDNPKHQNLWQHFRGWLFETEKPFFKPDEPTLFDFRVEQAGDCRFAYVLPFSETKALVEFTIFSEKLLTKEEYEFYLRKYISEVLRIEKFAILEIESGVIPMSDEPHEARGAPQTIRIGMAAGYVKPSTGYSFARTQRRLKKLIESLETNSIKHQKSEITSSNWKSFLDSVLLNVLLTKKHAADDVFTLLFSRNPASQILKFLDEDTSRAEDLRIMKSVPRASFAKAAIKIAAKNLVK
jgi:lycopene beta-cyclase